MPKSRSGSNQNPELSLRAHEGEGKIQGYFVLWDQVDSHNTKFQRGCFAKSIQERMDKIVIRNEHKNPIGKPVEIIEDERGAFFRGELNMDIQEGSDTFSNIVKRVVTGLSFAFRGVKDKFDEAGIRVFTECKLFEISPTWLPSGDDSRITGFRSGDNAEADTEYRSTDFNQTTIENTGWFLTMNLSDTLWDIWWSWRDGTISGEEAVAVFDKALADFHAAYLDFATTWIFGSSEERNDPFEDGIAKTFSIYLKDNNENLEQFGKRTGLNADEVKSLCRNKHIADPTRSALLPEELRKANNVLRNTQFEQVFTELRTIMTSAEITRANRLLEIASNAKSKDEDGERAADIFAGKGSQILAALNKMNGK